MPEKVAVDLVGDSNNGDESTQVGKGVAGQEEEHAALAQSAPGGRHAHGR
jgi:hypothetical protein